MAHDLLAELEGYRNELAESERHGKTARADAVRERIAGVVAGIREHVDRLVAQAEGHEDAGQDVLAAQARVEAKRLAAALPEDQRPAVRPLYADREAPADSAVPPGAESTADSTPRETATTRRGRASAS